MAPSLRLLRQADRARYVCGFAFNATGSRVVLIHQQRGIAAGFLNGIGGRVRAHESYSMAMHRLFLQQTGVLIGSVWTPFAIIEADDRRVQCYAAHLSRQCWGQIRTESDELVERCSIRALPGASARTRGVYHDVPFLIPLGVNPLPAAVVRLEYRAI
ncbi:MAG TPA: NUDIX hydrolase [Gemmatimonadaceae bacterium]|nr:NUDIX hydrolase [Gemmatimonadaceae bacterium]